MVDELVNRSRDRARVLVDSSLAAIFSVYILCVLTNGAYVWHFGIYNLAHARRGRVLVFVLITFCEQITYNSSKKTNIIFCCKKTTSYFPFSQVHEQGGGLKFLPRVDLLQQALAAKSGRAGVNQTVRQELHDSVKIE